MNKFMKIVLIIVGILIILVILIGSYNSLVFFE